VIAFFFFPARHLSRLWAALRAGAAISFDEIAGGVQRGLFPSGLILTLKKSVLSSGLFQSPCGKFYMNRGVQNDN
jgi:hypothetical protein